MFKTYNLIFVWFILQFFQHPYTIFCESTISDINENDILNTEQSMHTYNQYNHGHEERFDNNDEDINNYGDYTHIHAGYSESYVDSSVNDIDQNSIEIDKISKIGKKSNGHTLKSRTKYTKSNNGINKHDIHGDLKKQQQQQQPLQQHYKLQFQHLVLEGGGSRAISYVGALKALKDLQYYTNNRYRFEKIGGTSTGCFVGLIVALDIDPKKLESLIYKMDIITKNLNFDINLFDATTQQQSNKYNWFQSIIKSYNLIVKVTQLIDLWQNNASPGLSSEEKFIYFIRRHLLPLSPHAKRFESRQIITFYELYKITRHQLTCFATRLIDQSLVEFSVSKSPKENIFKGVYASMTIPGIFKPLDDNCGSPLIDGSLVNNFPITMNDIPSNNQISHTTLGLKLNDDNNNGGANDDDTDNTNDDDDDDDDYDYEYMIYNKYKNVKNNNNQNIDDNNNNHDDDYDDIVTDAIIDDNNDDAEGATTEIHHVQAPATTTTLQLRSATQPFKFKKLNTYDYATMLYTILLMRNNKMYTENPYNRNRIIYLNSPLKPLEFQIETQRIAFAIRRSYVKTITFFQKQQHEQKQLLLNKKLQKQQHQQRDDNNDGNNGNSSNHNNPENDTKGSSVDNNVFNIVHNIHNEL